ncbi:MAG: hypothetical protein WBQ70_03560 [Flavobacterium sp.]
MKKGDDFLAVRLKENESGNLNPVKPRWEKFIEKCDNNKLHFYIVSVDSINKYGINTVFKQNMYLKKEYFTIEDLEKINFQIRYSPDDIDFNITK